MGRRKGITVESHKTYVSDENTHGRPLCRPGFRGTRGSFPCFLAVSRERTSCDTLFVGDPGVTVTERVSQRPTVLPETKK